MGAAVIQCGAPGCCGTVQDQPDVVPDANCYLLKHMLHAWNDEDCKRILSNIRAASPGAPVFVVEHMVDPVEAWPLRGGSGRMVDLKMYVNTGGGMKRTYKEL